MTATIRTCPKCGKSFKGAGLNGHLRFVHQMPESEISGIVHRMKPVPAEDAPRWGTDPLLLALDDLLSLRKRSRALEEEFRSSVITDRWFDLAQDALKDMEKEALEKVKTLLGRKQEPAS